MGEYEMPRANFWKLLAETDNGPRKGIPPALHSAHWKKCRLEECERMAMSNGAGYCPGHWENLQSWVDRRGA